MTHKVKSQELKKEASKRFFLSIQNAKLTTEIKLVTDRKERKKQKNRKKERKRKTERKEDKFKL